MSARIWTVIFSTPSAAYVRGYGSRDALVELRGRAPVWSNPSRAWVVQPRTARDLIALAESRGVTVNLVEVAR